MSLSILRAATRGLSRPSVAHPFRARPIASTSRLAHTSAQSDKKNKQTSPLHTRNENIPFRVVRVVHEETNRLSDEWVALSDILHNLKRAKYYVELVALNPDPVVKIIKSSDVYNKMRARAERRKVRREQKEVQMTWAISPGDLAHKLAKVREELEAGNRVDLVYMSKSGQPKPTPEQVEAQAAETVKLLEDAGAEWKPRTTTKTTLIMSFQGHNEPGIAADNAASLNAQMEEKGKKRSERRQRELMKQTKHQKPE